MITNITIFRLGCLAETKLSEYEKTVAVAAEEGINMTHPMGKHAKKWTYTQAVFFAATILTTIGE